LFTETNPRFRAPFGENADRSDRAIGEDLDKNGGSGLTPMRRF
jgi:hypothetical protein